MSQYEIIAKRLSELRKEKGVTQDEIANEINVKRTTIANYETGKRAPDYETLIRLADIYGVSCDYIIRGVNSEFADIHRVTGLTNEAIEKLAQYKESDIISKGIDYILTHPKLVKTLTTYLLSTIYQEYSQSDYKKYLPVRFISFFIEDPDLAQKVAFSELLEQLPFAKEDMTNELKNSKKLLDRMLFSMAVKLANFDEIDCLLEDEEPMSQNSIDLSFLDNLYTKYSSDWLDELNEKLELQEKGEDYSEKSKEFLHEFIQRVNKERDEIADNSEA